MPGTGQQHDSGNDMLRPGEEFKFSESWANVMLNIVITILAGEIT